MKAKLFSILSLLLLGTTLLTTGCNTTRGFGQDVESLGDSIEDSAQRNKGY